MPKDIAIVQDQPVWIDAKPKPPSCHVCQRGTVHLMTNKINQCLQLYQRYNQAFCQEINNSDCVLAPYIKFYGSSGMIGHACRYGKPLLVSYEGLIGEIVRDNKLGLCVDPQNIKALSLALEAIIASNFEYSKSNAIIYYENASHLQFAKNLLD